MSVSKLSASVKKLRLKTCVLAFVYVYWNSNSTVLKNNYLCSPIGRLAWRSMSHFQDTKNNWQPVARFAHLFLNRSPPTWAELMFTNNMPICVDIGFHHWIELFESKLAVATYRWPTKTFWVFDKTFFETLLHKSKIIGSQRLITTKV